jgi:hypothetical protein
MWRQQEQQQSDAAPAAHETEAAAKSGSRIGVLCLVLTYRSDHVSC